MRVLLVNPWYEYKERKIWRYTRVWPPLDLAIAAALLEHEGIETDILDMNAERKNPEKLVKKYTGFDKIFVTSSPIDRWQCPHLDLESLFHTIDVIKDSNPGAELFLMGYHGTVRPKEMLELTRADGIIMGEPEFTVLDVCKSSSLHKVKGVAFMSDGKVIITKRKRPVSMSKFPVPAFHLLPMKKYKYEILGDHFTLLETSRGCPFQCTFCAKNVMYGKGYRKKPLKNVEKELDTLLDFGIETFYFIDLEFTVDKNFVSKICDLLIQKDYGLKWACQTRADALNYQLMKKMKKAGCTLIHYGIESGSPRILKATKKMITHERIKKGVEMAKRVRIDTACFMMMGLPGETKEDMEMSIDFIKEIDPTYASFNVATPYPGTAFYDIVSDELDDLFPSIYTGLYSERFLRHMVRKAFIEFYLRPGYFFKRLKKSPKYLWDQINLFSNFVR